MAFGQPGGPPASAKQIRELLELLEAAGHSDFRDARGPMGFTQRQAGGKFTRDEVQEFIDRLEEASFDQPPPPPSTRATPKPVVRPVVKPVVKPVVTGPAAVGPTLRSASDEEVLAEVRRRGLTLPEP